MHEQNEQNEQNEQIDLAEIHANINKLMAQTMMLAAETSKLHMESAKVTSETGTPNLETSKLSLGSKLYLMMAIGSFVGATIASALTVWLLV